MKRYTKEQLIAAMTLYNKNVAENPDDFAKINLSDFSDEKSTAQVEYLLSLVV